MSRTIVGGREPGRNESCPCGSGLKYKHCHGSSVKQQIVQKFAAALMMQLIHREQMERGLVPWPYTCKSCGKGFLKPKESAVAPGIAICPHCSNPDITKTESPEVEAGTTIIGGKE